MPKIFKVHLEVEEVALGSVISKLHTMPGVVSFNPLLGDAKGANKNAKSQPNGAGAKTPYKGDQTGDEFLIALLKKKPMKAKEIQDAFEKIGRSPGSYASLVHNAKKDGVIQQKEQRGVYTLTKKGRDKARFVK